MKYSHHNDSQSGQTLIETMVAIFILVMGITASLGLALYSWNASSNITQEIIATGLAREGIEAIKNIRDTNWLKQTSINSDCYDYSSGSQNAKCYRNWETQWMSISPPGGTKSYSFGFDPSAATFWQLATDDAAKYGLQFDSNITGVAFKGYYNTDVSNPVSDGSSVFYRNIIITEIRTSPFDVDTAYPELLVESQVWWRGQKCPQVQSYAAAPASCKVDLQTYLTNWKNY